MPADLTGVTTVTYADLITLHNMQEELAKLKTAEAMLRRRVATQFFPTPTEGSAHNKYPLSNLGDTTGAILQMDHKVNRTVLEDELDALKSAVKEEGSNLPKLPFNKLIKYEPKLVKAEYNKLTDEERKVFDRALEIKDGMPEVKIVIPKRGS